MEPIAIIGLSCRFPGARNPEEFWQLLRNGVDAIIEVPTQRWDIESLYDSEPGGVNLILSPEATITFSQARMMAPDGRCKTFDAGADGYVRGEGCGVVILKRLKDAITDGDNIQAVIRGSAVNQDGLTNGLTAPNGPSQQAVIRQALENAGVEPGHKTNSGNGA